MTDAQAKEIETTGIIPSHLLNEYLAGKNLVKPELTTEQSAAEEVRFKTSYEAYKANMKSAQKAANEQLKYGFKK